MSDINVGHEEANIACTIVLLKRVVEAGIVPAPLAVEIALGSEAGWRRAAIEHLDNTRRTLRRPVRKNDSGKWEEFNEELDFDDRKAQGVEGPRIFLP